MYIFSHALLSGGQAPLRLDATHHSAGFTVSLTMSPDAFDRASGEDLMSRIVQAANAYLEEKAHDDHHCNHRP